MSRITPSDEAVVAKARQALAARRKLRWALLLYAALFLGLSGYFTVLGVRRIEDLDAAQLRSGFVFGLALAVTWTTFGVLGAICLGKFLAGFRDEFRPQELLVRYHDRLRDLGELPGDQNGGRDAAGGGRRAGPEPDRTPPARAPRG